MATGGHTYQELVVSNLQYEDAPSISFPYIANTVLIISDTTTDTLEFSLNGRVIAGKLNWSDEKLVLSGAEIGKIWFKTNNPAGTTIRIYAEA